MKDGPCVLLVINIIYLGLNYSSMHFDCEIGFQANPYCTFLQRWNSQTLMRFKRTAWKSDSRNIFVNSYVLMNFFVKNVGL
jgi:hypothetical protein